MKVFLAKEALAMAYFRRRAGKGLLHHSDRGGQDAGHESQDQLKQSGMIWSMSRKGDGWDNSVVESFFHPLKTECTHQKGYLTGEEAFDIVQPHCANVVSTLKKDSRHGGNVWCGVHFSRLARDGSGLLAPSCHHHPYLSHTGIGLDHTTSAT